MFGRARHIERQKVKLLADLDKIKDELREMTARLREEADRDQKECGNERAD